MSLLKVYDVNEGAFALMGFGMHIHDADVPGINNATSLRYFLSLEPGTVKPLNGSLSTVTVIVIVNDVSLEATVAHLCIAQTTHLYNRSHKLLSSLFFAEVFSQVVLPILFKSWCVDTPVLSAFPPSLYYS
jgi:hypothetical protein